ncbi:MAG: hypothetical protein KJ043_02875 [Anaerolineae bacterium]|nr:hypothetical protein [Anaerolineae bacterium]
MNLNEFVEKFTIVKGKGFIASVRGGAGGVGHTLEYELGITENNISSPDLGDIELKASREKASSRITLLTLDNEIWKMNQLEAIHKYGSPDKNGRLGMYYTLASKPNRAGLFIDISSEKIVLLHERGEIITIWKMDDIKTRFLKVNKLILAIASAKKIDGIEYFHYIHAKLLEGINTELLYNHFMERNIVIELRLHDKNNNVRNHGTCFRISKKRLPLLYSKIDDLV